jgi:pimeloyl-ACP methyl ester carboxylesterase
MIVIHGSGGCGTQMQPLTDALAPYGPVRAPDLVGHHGRPIPERFSVGDFAEDLVAFLDREGIESDFFIGYSFGGYLALYLARHFPGRVKGACALATKLVFDAETVKHFTHLADPERIRRAGRAAIVEKAHAPQDWTQVALKHRPLWAELGREPALTAADFAAIAVPVMLVSSNRDPVTPWAEIAEHGKIIPDCHLAMFYGAAHPIDSVPVHSVAQAIAQWMERVEKR